MNKNLIAYTANAAIVLTFFLSGSLATAAEPKQFRVGSCTAEQNSVFEADTQWLKLQPNQSLGDITAVVVGEANHLWVLHRPASVEGVDPSWALPPVVEFDENGVFVQAFGGPSDQYEWPEREHSLAIADNGNLWISGSAYLDLEPGHGDDMLIVLDNEGGFVQQIGHRGASKGNLDRENLDAPADIFVDDTAEEVYVADGYGNQRLVVLSEANGSFLRMWGAFGSNNFPESVADLENMQDSELGEGPASFNSVHGVEIADDGKVYVSDRGNQRIQVFTSQGEYLAQTFVNQGYPSSLTASGITFSKDEAQQYMFVTDWGNSTLEVFDRETLDHIGRIGRAGTQPGEFLGPHLIDTDSSGIIYISEVQGARMQRLIPCHTENGSVKLW